MSINVDFATNPDPRVACVLLLDTSSSMSGQPIQALNQALQDFQLDIQQDDLAKRRADIAIVTFGGTVQTIQDFTSAGEFKAPTLVASGGTPMGSAIVTAISMVNKRKAEYKDNDIPVYRPWIFLMTDGEPTDDWSHAAKMVKAELRKQPRPGLELFAIGVGGAANMEVLSALTPRTLRLDGLKFRECFLWLSASMKSVSNSGDPGPNNQAALPGVTFGSPV